MGNVTHGCDFCTKRAQTGAGRTLHALVRHRVWMTGRTIERTFNRAWGDLAAYNGERARGIVHNPAIAARMAEKQAAWEHKLVQVPDRIIYICSHCHQETDVTAEVRRLALVPDETKDADR